jgi:hypothetical protein
VVTVILLEVKLQHSYAKRAVYFTIVQSFTPLHLEVYIGFEKSFILLMGQNKCHRFWLRQSGANVADY